MSRALLTLVTERDRDVVQARQRARQIAALVGFDVQDQIRIATAVSELARLATLSGAPGAIEFGLVDTERRQHLGVQVTLRPPDLPPGMLCDTARWGPDAEISIVAARRMMDRFRIEAADDGRATISLSKMLPRKVAPVTAARLAAIAGELDRNPSADPYQEIQEQNRELLASLEELRQKQEELARLNAELADTNRGVVALYAELDERAEQLRRADEMKSRFLSNVSHEFRTPVNSIRALGRLLLDRTDGDLTPEQERQASYIVQAAAQLGQLVDDLLDLAKVEAGKVELRPELFTVSDLFGALRGMMKPLLTNERVTLTLTAAEQLPPLLTDKGKLAQILRNLVSNALKFTERGSVSVTAEAGTDGRMVFTVGDTGIGIAPEDQERIFDEFVQVAGPLQSRVKGTGLGLPLSRRLAELLGGTLTVQSARGRGSVFTLTLARITPPAGPEPRPEAPASTLFDRRLGRVLIIDDDEIERYALRQALGLPAETVSEAPTGQEGLAQAREERPDLVFLDLAMPGMEGVDVLAELRADPALRDTPVIIFTSRDLDADDRRRLVSADAILFKSALSREIITKTMAQVLKRAES